MHCERLCSQVITCVQTPLSRWSVGKDTRKNANTPATESAVELPARSRSPLSEHPSADWQSPLQSPCAFPLIQVQPGPCGLVASGAGGWSLAGRASPGGGGGCDPCAFPPQV